MPAPTSPSVADCSYTYTSKPAADSDSAAVRPPMPAPTTPTETARVPDMAAASPARRGYSQPPGDFTPASRHPRPGPKAAPRPEPDVARAPASLLPQGDEERPVAGPDPCRAGQPDDRCRVGRGLAAGRALQ